MAVLFLILLPLLALSLWLFANYLPRTHKLAAVQRYNRIAAVVALLSPIGVTTYFWYVARHTTLTASWPILAILASILTIAVLLVIATLLRKVIFDNGEED